MELLKKYEIDLLNSLPILEYTERVEAVPYDDAWLEYEEKKFFYAETNSCCL